MAVNQGISIQMDEQCLVQAEGLCKTFRTRHFLQLDEDTRKRRWYKSNTVHAADSVSFGIRPGEIFGLLGPNGAGKTTIVKMISGLVRPDRGQVFVDGMDVEKKRKQILRKVGVVLEGTRTSIWPLTPLENLVYYGNLRNVRGKALKDRAHELLDFIGLKEKKNIEVRRLSRGQKQKLAICIALISDPMVLLLDEPTTGLDVQSARAIKDKIAEMTKAQGRSVLVTTHDMHVAQELCDRIGIIDRGKMVACQPTGELLGLFSEQLYLFRLNRSIAPSEVAGLPGVVSADVDPEESVPHILVQLTTDPQLRSEAFYALTQRLSGLGIELHGIEHRQSNLERVFLKLTTSTI